MSEAATLPNEIETAQQKSSRNKGLLIFSAILLPMLAAYFIFKTGIGMPGGTVNKGDLLVPATAIVDLQLHNDDGSPATSPITEQSLWRMIIPVSGSCDDQCLRQLYISRQVHIRLGEKAIRVERWLLNAGAALPETQQQHLQKEHPRLRFFNINAEQWRELFADTSVAEHRLDGHHIYMVDQQGYAMMSYNPKHEGADLLTDIKRLLKYSYED